MRALGFALAAGLLALPSPASACSPFVNNLWQQDPAQASDAVPPSAPTVEVIAVRRDREEAGCGAMSTCGSLATIHLAVSATDDRATEQQLGYELRLVGGDPPGDFTAAFADRFSPFGGELVFYFDINSPSFSMDLEVRAVDGNGNLGPPTVVTVADTVDEGNGCAAGANGNLVGSGMLAGVLALLLVPRRRR